MGDSRTETGAEAEAKSLQHAKAELRARNRKVRGELGNERRELASRSVCLHLLDSHLYSGARTLAAYLAFADEVDLASLIATALAERPAKRVTLPRMVPGLAGSLTLHLADLEDLEQHPHGPRQPTSASPLIQPAELDLVLLPGLAFDLNGGRLGYGRGYYDRLLAHVPQAIPRIGVGFDALVVESVPVAAHDAGLTHLVTESGLREIIPPSDPNEPHSKPTGGST